MSDINEELEQMCKSIADELNGYASGHYVYANGEFVEDEDEEDEGIGQYLNDSSLDIDIVTSIDGCYRGAEVTVSCGGPTVWIDTRTSTVKGVWGSARAEAGITGNARDMIDEEIKMYMEA